MQTCFWTLSLVTLILMGLILVITLAKITKRKSWHRPLQLLCWLFSVLCCTTFHLGTYSHKKQSYKNESFQPFGVFATWSNTFFPHCISSSHNLLHKRSRKTQLHTGKNLEPWQPLHTHKKSWVITSELLSHKLLLHVVRVTHSYTQTHTYSCIHNSLEEYGNCISAKIIYCNNGCLLTHKGQKHRENRIQIHLNPKEQSETELIHIPRQRK